MTDYATTGDGLLAGLQFLAALVETEKTASELASVFTPCPQVLKNVSFTKGCAPLENDKVKKEIANAQKTLLGNGRLLIRASGTEPLIRVMVESENEALLKQIVDEVSGAISAAS